MKNVDRQVSQLLEKERQRQESNLNLIASENHSPEIVRQAMASVLNDKYAEGYPGKRYYGGCAVADEVELLAIARAKELFGGEHINVQPHSGTQANLAVYLSVLNIGDTVMGLSLSHGGHLSHGSPVNFTGKYFNFVPYQLGPKDELLDYEAIHKLALTHRPKMIVSGASAYSRTWDWSRLRQICDEVGAYLLADIAHYAGLVAAGIYPSPVPYADFVTMTTHKTLRGPRGAIIICKENFASLIDKSVFPGNQGGPFLHVIAAKAVAFGLALTDEFKQYQKQVLLNARTLAKELATSGLRIVSGGTDCHMFLVDLRQLNLTGQQAEKLLADVNITVNKNTIPYDPQKPAIASGIRLGTPAITSRGLKEEEVILVGQLIGKVLKNPGQAEVVKKVKEQVQEICQQFPLPE